MPIVSFDVEPESQFWKSGVNRAYRDAVSDGRVSSAPDA
jgi:hypothetical protein